MYFSLLKKTTASLNEVINECAAYIHYIYARSVAFAATIVLPEVIITIASCKDDGGPCGLLQLKVFASV